MRLRRLRSICQCTTSRRGSKCRQAIYVLLIGFSWTSVFILISLLYTTAYIDIDDINNEGLIRRYKRNGEGDSGLQELEVLLNNEKLQHNHDDKDTFMQQYHDNENRFMQQYHDNDNNKKKMEFMFREKSAKHKKDFDKEFQLDLYDNEQDRATNLESRANRRKIDLSKVEYAKMVMTDTFRDKDDKDTLVFKPYKKLRGFNSESNVDKRLKVRGSSLQDEDRPWRCSGCFQWRYRSVYDPGDICWTDGGRLPVHVVLLMPSTAHTDEDFYR